MAGLADLLAGDSGSLNAYLAEDPYYIGGRGMMREAPPAYMGNSGMWASALQNFLGGALQGYGREHAMDTAFKAYQASPLLQDSGDTIGPSKYLSSTRPEGWTPRIGQQDLALAGALKQNQLAAALKAQEQKGELLKALAPKMYEYGDTQGLAQILGQTSPVNVPVETKPYSQKVADALATGSTEGLRPDDAKDVVKAKIAAETEILNKASTRPETVAYSAGKSIVDTMEKSRDLKTPAADMSFIYGLPKLLDPSVVKEGEMVMMMKNMPGLERYAREIEGAFTGTARLSREAKDAILEIAKIKYASLGEQYNRAITPYAKQVSDRGLEPARALPFPTFTPFPATAMRPNPASFGSGAEYVKAYRAWEASNAK